MITGNHDKRATLDQLGVDRVDEWVIGDILLRHAPEAHPSRYVLAGHLHPGATLRDGKLAHRYPAFWIGPRRCLLPAYGLLTGLAPSSPEKNDRVAILTPGGVLMKRAIGERNYRRPPGRILDGPDVENLAGCYLLPLSVD